MRCLFIFTIHPSVLHYHTMAWTEAIFHRSQSHYLVSTIYFFSSAFSWENYWKLKGYWSLQPHHSSRLPLIHPSPVPTISVNQPLPVEYIIVMVSSIENLHQNPQRHAPGGPRQALFCPAPLLSFSHPGFSLPVRLFGYSSILPSVPLPPSQWLLAVWGQRSSSFIFEIQCSSQSTMLHCTLSLPLMSRTQKKSCFQDSDWNLVTAGQWHVVAHLKWGQIKSGCLH